ncbi:HPP family protein [Flavobacterium pectinovorum]|uniref:HPP family protein n=1 Tax=Flavobacterium pectinovorum TaxID=29533 RepID=UPI001FAD7311|nr:HPP family protein [Flavobacterium pectinovorum]MCI9845554.1 HPP family protein [Flavobacterium pectinovorum]
MNKIFYNKSIIGFGIIIVMIAASVIFDSREIILPEMAALAVGCLMYQNPIWLSKPLHIFLLPSITAVLGFLVNMLDLELAQKLILILILMLLVLKLFKSFLAPALATGLLPVITNAESYSFIISILLLTSALSLYLILVGSKQKVDCSIKQHSSREGLIYMLFVAVWILICNQEKWMFMAAIPPVIVTGYEAVHKEAYEVDTFRKQVICMFLASFAGIQSIHFLDNLILAVLLDIAAVYLILSIFKCRLPPAYAMAILPMVLNASYAYFYFQVLLMSIIILGTVFLYKNAVLRKSFGIFRPDKNL